MNRLLFLFIAAACGGSAKPATTTTSNSAPTPAKLGPTIAKADFDARIAAHQLSTVSPERLPDEGGDVGPIVDGPRVKLEGDVLSALGCRPGGDVPAFVSDGHYIYLTSQSTKLSMPAGQAGMPTPSTYCSFQRFRIPHDLEYAGALEVK